MIKVILIAAFILLIILFLLICYAGNYLYNLGINPKFPKTLIFGSSSENETSVNQNETSGAINNDSELWLLKKSGYEDLFITSKDNLKLYNYLIKNKNFSNKWVITVHGYTSEGKYMAPYAQKFYDMGYNIIIPDLRGHGKSEGNYIGMGWDERFDIISLTNYISNNYPNSEIVLFGVSMGAATVMNVSGEKLPSNVKAIIEDCGYTSAWNQFSYKLKQLFKLPEFPMMYSASMITKFRAGYFISDVSVVNQLKKSITPTLFIHGDKDDFVPFFMLDELYNSSPVDKQKLIIPEAGHAKAAITNPELYWNSIKQFLSKYTH